MSLVNGKYSHLDLTLDMIQNHNVIMTTPISNLLLESDAPCKGTCSESQSPGSEDILDSSSVFGTEAGRLNHLLNIS